MIFSQEKHKLLKTNNLNQNNENALRVKKEILVDFNSLKDNINATQTIVETDYIPVAPNNYSLQTNIVGQLLPQDYNVNLDLILNIPEYLLNYLKIQLSVKVPPEHKLISFTETSNTYFIDNYCKIYGDSTLIYQGPIPIPLQSRTVLIDNVEWVLLQSSRTLTPQQIIAGDAPANHCKKIYGGLFKYINGDDYRTNGEITFVIIIEESQEVEPGVFKFKKFTVNPGTVELSSNSSWLHKILALSDTQITAIGDYVDEITSYPDIITSENIEKTYNYADVVSADINVFGYGYNLTTSTDDGLGNYNVSLSTAYYIYTQLVAYRLYWDVLTQGDFYVNVESLGTEHVTLSSMPSTIFGHTLQYNSYTLEKNLPVFPIPVQTDNLVFDPEEIMNFPIGDKYLTYYKITEDKYRINYRTTFTVLAPATSAVSINYISDGDVMTQQEDVYISNGTEYLLSSSNDIPVAHTMYQSEYVDAEYKIRLTIQNPNYWKEERKYGD